MNRTIRAVAMTALLSTMAGCGLNSGFIRDSSSAQVMDYRMEISASRYLRSVSGSASDGAILCIFPIDGQQYTRAMNELYAAAALKPNEALQNLREDHSFRFYLFYCKNTLTVSGDVMELTPKQDNPSTIIVPTQATQAQQPAPSAQPVKPAKR